MGYLNIITNFIQHTNELIPLAISFSFFFVGGADIVINTIHYYSLWHRFGFRIDQLAGEQFPSC